MTVRDLLDEIQLQGAEIVLRVYDESYDNLLCSFSWECDCSGYPDSSTVNDEKYEDPDDAFDDALDYEVRFIFPESYKTTKNACGFAVRLVVETVNE